MARSRNRIWILAASIAGCFLHARLVAAQEPAAAANANDEVERAEVSASENLAAETNVAPEGNVAGEDAESTADEETATSEPATEDNGVRGETHDNDRAPSMLLATPRAESHSFQLLIPPFLRQESREVTTTVFFPFVHLRESRAFAEDGAALPGTSELLIPPIYHREGPTSGDVVFPFFWFFRDQEGRADVAIPPVYSFNNRRGHDSGFFPFFFTGEHDATVSATDSAASTTRVRRSYYHLIPPLLTAAWGDANEDYLFATLAYRIRQRGDERFGFFPLVWFRNSPTEHYQIAAPLFGRYQTPTQTWTVVPPALFYLLEKPNESFAGVFGLVHHNEGPGHHSTTIPPLLFHFSEAPNTWRLVTPLFLSMHENGTDTFATWLYQRYRGVTEFDGVLPVFANYRDPRDGTHMTMATPLVWSWGDPGNDNWLVLPFAGSFHRHGREQTTLIAPNIQISQWHDGNAFNIYPLWFYENVMLVETR